MSKKYGEPKPVQPFIIGLAAVKIHEGLQELYESSLGYRPQEKYDTANRIARLAVVLANRRLSSKKRTEVQTAFDQLVAAYKTKFNHTNG